MGEFLKRWRRERQIHKDADQWVKKVTGSLDALRDSLARPANDPERFQAIQVASASVINNLEVVKGSWAASAGRVIQKVESEDFQDRIRDIDPLSGAIMEPMKEAMLDEAMTSNMPLEDVPMFAWYTAARWYKKQIPQK